VIEYEGYRLRTVISGGQTGADQAGLAAAQTFNLQTGGFAPAGFKTVLGNMPQLGSLFGLVEAGTYQQRTALNVKHFDATLRFASNFKSPGERLTLACINKYSKPHLDVQLPCSDPLTVAAELAAFIKDKQVWTLNVAGNADRDVQFGKHFTQTFGILLLAFELLQSEGLLQETQ